MIKKASLLTACSVTAFSAWAQDTSPDTLVVTANRFEQPRSTVLAPTTVVTRQDIDRWQSTSVNDVLRRLPGVDITQNGGSGQLSSIFIRGTNASHVLVLIDGVRLNLAGVSLTPMQISTSHGRLPRLRGGEPYTEKLNEKIGQSSPPTRG